MKRSLPQALYRAEQVRELDRVTIEEHGIDGFLLMQRAARCCFDALVEQWGGGDRILVACGSGNNAGDGYVVAALARQAGFEVSVAYLSDPQTLQGSAKEAWCTAQQSGVLIEPWQSGCTISEDVVVDALLGTGLSGDVRGAYVDAINTINNSKARVLAVDIPSGLCADSGSVLGVAVKADVTVTFIGLKRGLMTASGPVYVGKLLYDDLDVPSQVFRQIPAEVNCISPCRLANSLPSRSVDAHKGRHGHLLVVGGNTGMAGAAMLAAEAALYSGAGLVSVATRPEHVSAFVARRPELMTKPVVSAPQLRELIAGKSALVVGPGLGQDEWAKTMLKTALEANVPLLLDADALNLIADSSDWLDSHSGVRVITPHPGEAARLLNSQTVDVQRDRFTSALKLQQSLNATVVLKGVGTIVQSQNSTFLCDRGNPGMGVGGMGDLLSGVIGSLLAQGLEGGSAAQLGVWFHSAAADVVAEQQGIRGLLPSDLLVQIRKLINNLNEMECLSH